MAGPVLLQDRFDLGIRRDVSKDKIGSNAAWNLLDYVPNRKGAPLTRRGGWEKKGAWGAGASNIQYINAGILAPFNGGRYILAADEDGAVWRITTGGATWEIDGTTRDVNLIKQNPIFYFDDVFWPSFDGTQTMSRSSETTTSEYTWQSALPAGDKSQYLTAWKNRLIGASNENIYFGPPGDPNQLWDVDALYVQTQPIRGLATVRSAILVFYDGKTEIIRGTAPAGYGATSDDIRIDVLFPEIGLISAFSICGWNDMIVWADRNGVYYTDGAAASDLTEMAGVRDLWRSVFYDNEAAAQAGQLRVAAGVFSDLLHVTVTNTTTLAHVDTFVFDIPKRIAWRYTNCPFPCYIRSPIQPHELFAGGIQASGLVAEMSHTIDTDNPTDETTTPTPVLPVVEFPYYRFGAGGHRIVDVYLGYVLEGAYQATVDIDPAGANNTLTYTAVAPGADGNDITIAYVVAGLNTPLSVGVVGNAITVNVATDGAGAPTSTGTQVLAAVQASAPASALVTAAANGTITGVVAAVAATNLAGGTELLVQFTTDPHPENPQNPAYADYNDGDEYVYAGDIHGVDNDGYHYRRIPVRLEGSGVGVKVTQIDQSTRTAIYNLSVAALPREGWEQI